MGEQLESADCNREAGSGDASRDEELNTMPSCSRGARKKVAGRMRGSGESCNPPLDVLEEYLQEETEAPAINQPAATLAPTTNPVLIVSHVPSDENEQRIKHEQRARMETNKQKALGRARARKLELEQSISNAPP